LSLFIVTNSLLVFHKGEKFDRENESGSQHLDRAAAQQPSEGGERDGDADERDGNEPAETNYDDSDSGGGANGDAGNSSDVAGGDGSFIIDSPQPEGQAVALY
jgi:hypothetical protein